MNLTLVNDSRLSTGIFGTLFSSNKSLFIQTLQHAYPFPPDGPVSDSTVWIPKIPQGTYTCVRGTHTLEPTELHLNPQPFETFMIMGIPPFEGKLVTRVLFHIANYNEELEGCIAVGMSRILAAIPPAQDMICNSGIAFKRFIEAQIGCDKFQLTVS